MAWTGDAGAASLLYCACGHHLRVDDPRPGRVVQCPECGAWQRVPVPEARPAARRSRRKRADDGLRSCLLYPISDGSGVALLVVLPPIMWLMSVPVFDILRYLFPVDRTFNPIALVIVPLTLPLLIGFVLFFGYILLFLGRVLVASAMGDAEHPRWPPWDRLEILEGLGRWTWALLFGVGIGGFPVLIYWKNCGDLDLIDWIVLTELVAVGVAYAQMALAAALLHDSIAAANPVTVVQAIGRIGWAYLRPALLGGVAVMLAGGLLWVVLTQIPAITAAAFGLWAYWVAFLYLATVLMRVVGLTYYRHRLALGWYRTARPRWGAERLNRIYVNS